MLKNISAKLNKSGSAIYSAINYTHQRFTQVRLDVLDSLDSQPRATVKGGRITDLGMRLGAQGATGIELVLQYIVGRGVRYCEYDQPSTFKLTAKQYGVPWGVVGNAFCDLGNKFGVAGKDNLALVFGESVMAGVRFLTIALPGACLMALAFGIAAALHITCVTAYDLSALLAKQAGLLRDKCGTCPVDTTGKSGSAPEPYTV